ncbi:hypothetical protein H4219_002828 [Mycoemilia scoparia]|uniref:non-specific serine/threonine protein kinase n=1 Tax=Mycoemilia scoparia TaxID=417184 RepID=A0A9W7ZWK0_9FUNG|nr:hypothetical protein H4219_002828 [Mycoemilia scoparia]
MNGAVINAKRRAMAKKIKPKIPPPPPPPSQQQLLKTKDAQKDRNENTSKGNQLSNSSPHHHSSSHGGTKKSGDGISSHNKLNNGHYSQHPSEHHHNHHYYRNDSNICDDNDDSRPITSDEGEINSNNGGGSHLSDEEDVSDYRKGGYHPISIGDRFKDHRYIVVRKLGWGHFSTVWLAYDSHRDIHVALKVVKSASHYTEAAKDEVKLCARVAVASETHYGRPHVVELLDDFEHSGPHGRHVCMVFEVLGENLLSLLRNSEQYHSLTAALNAARNDPKMVGEGQSSQIPHNPDASKNGEMRINTASSSSYPANIKHTTSGGGGGGGGGGSGPTDSKVQGLPVPLVKKISRQILRGLAYMHGVCGIIHTDLKPENILVCIDNVEDVIRRELAQKNQLVQPAAVAATTTTTTTQKISTPTKKKSSANINNPSGSFQLGTEIQPHKFIQESWSVSNSGAVSRAHSIEPSPEPPGSPRHNSNTVGGGSKSSKSTTPARGSGLRNDSNSSGSKNKMDIESPTNVTKPSSQLGSLERNFNGFNVGDQLSTLNPQTHIINTSNNKNQQPPEFNNNNNNNNNPATAITADINNNNNGTSVVASSRGLRVKIADLGNATWKQKHFTEDIQTRQYRSPEVIIGAKWDETADIWSCACLIFELLTGEYLFEPHSGDRFDKDEDHLAQIMETLGPFSKPFARSGRYSSEFFNRHGQLRHIPRLNPLYLEDLLYEEYGFSRPDANELTDFLMPMLAINPRNRVKAEVALMHPWLYK